MKSFVRVVVCNSSPLLPNYMHIFLLYRPICLHTFSDEIFLGHCFFQETTVAFLRAEIYLDTNGGNIIVIFRKYSRFLTNLRQDLGC